MRIYIYSICKYQSATDKKVFARRKPRFCMFLSPLAGSVRGYPNTEYLTCLKSQGMCPVECQIKCQNIFLCQTDCQMKIELDTMS